MRLVEFLILLLETHAQTLQRLAALFGEDVLLEILEQAGDRDDEESAPAFYVKAEWFERPRPGSPQSPYAELESAVHDLKLPAVLEFHLWAYPHYRHYIECGVDLNARIPGENGETGSLLVEEAIHQADRWVRKLGIAPAIAPQAERAAHVPWLRFRTATFKRIGVRPIGAVP